MGARQRPGDAPRRRSAVERRRRHRHCRSRMGQALRHGQRLLQQGPRRAGRLRPRRSEGPDQGSPPPSQAVRRRRCGRPASSPPARSMPCRTTASACTQDHANAQILAEAIRAADGLSLQPDTVETNIVIFRVEPTPRLRRRIRRRAESRRCPLSRHQPHAGPPRHPPRRDRIPMHPSRQNHPRNGRASGRRQKDRERTGAGVLTLTGSSAKLKFPASLATRVEQS